MKLLGQQHVGKSFQTLQCNRMQVEARPAHLTSIVFESWAVDSGDGFPFERTDYLKRLTWGGPNLDGHIHTIASFSQLTELRISSYNFSHHQDIRDWPRLPALRVLHLQDFEAGGPFLLHPFVHLVR